MKIPFSLIITAAALLWLFPSPLAAQAQVRPGDANIQDFLRHQVGLLSQSELAGARSREEWEAHRPKLKEQFWDMLGLWPVPERTPLKAQVTGTLERDSFKVEKIHFQSLPGLYVTGNLYLPRVIAPGTKLPSVLYVCGHAGKGRDGNKTAFQQHGMWFATHGFACLIIDTLQLGEIAGIHHGTYNRDRWWWHSAGYTSAGVECWNGVRAIDYLVSRPEVDAEKIAVTGISGGGAATFWIAAADERVKVAVPASGMSDLQSYVTDKIANGHCDCMFLYNTHRWEWTTIAALIAPRPLLFENSGHDTIFPMDGNERIRLRLERLYGWYQKKPGELFDIGVTPGGHNDNVELRLMAYRWISRHLKNDNAEVSEPRIEPFTGEQLRVFPTDADLPKDSLNARIDETFVPRIRPLPPANRETFDHLKKELRDALLARVFTDWPAQIDPASIRDQAADGKLTLATEPGIVVEATRRPPRGDDAAKPGKLWLVVLNANDPPGQLPKWAGPFVKDAHSALILNPRGTGTLAWTRKNPPNYVERAHALIGRTVDAGRVHDIQAVARWLHETDASGLTISAIGEGQSAALAAYAALFEPNITEVVAVAPPASHMDGPHFLSVLRVLEIPDAFGLLAPRRLTLVNAPKPAFERTIQQYNGGGYADRLKVE